MFDLYTFFIHLNNNQNQLELPGFHAVSAPKNASRLRAQDFLIGLFSFNNPAVAVCDALFQKLAEQYFASTGTVTAGMRAAVEKLNASLLQRNLKAGGEGGQIFGPLTLAVLHNDSLYLLQSGETHAFTLTSAWVQDYTDISAGRGVGVGRALNLRYFQERIQPGDLLVLSPKPPERWTPESLAGSPGLTLDHLRRRLLNQSGPDLQAAVVQFQKGKGQVHRLRLRVSQVPGAAAAIVPAETPPETTAASAVEPPVDIPVEPAADEPLPSPTESLPASPSVLPPASAPEEILPPVQAQSVIVQPVSAAVEKAPVQQTPPPAHRRSERQAAQSKKETASVRAPKPKPVASAPTKPRVDHVEELRKKLASSWLKWRSSRQRTGSAISGFFARLMPGKPDRPPAVSPGLLLFIAIIVPLAVVAVAMTVYYQRGQSQQQVIYLQQAQQLIQQAEEQDNSALKRNSYNQALTVLVKAEKYGRTDETRALHNQAQQALDNLDGVVRLEVTPAVPGGFASSINIVRMAASGTDVYLLDGGQGRVLRMFLTGEGYVVDPQFRCSPGPSGGIIISELVDIITIPPTAPNHAQVMAIDNAGNILLCVAGEEPLSLTLPAPGSMWGNLNQIAYFQQSLYVLDNKLSAVWVYGSDSHLGFSDQPSMFFGSDVPYMADVVDTAVFADNLFLLHKDGRMTKCTYSGFAEFPTRCTDPIPYAPSEDSQERPIVMPNTKFIQMEYTQPFSLYLLDAETPSIYHFSTALNLQQQLRPDPRGDYPLPDSPPTAFTITPELTVSRRVFVAFGNQVFYAPLP